MCGGGGGGGQGIGVMRAVGNTYHQHKNERREGGEGRGSITLAGFESSRVKQLSSSRKSNPANTCVVVA